MRLIVLITYYLSYIISRWKQENPSLLLVLLGGVAKNPNVKAQMTIEIQMPNAKTQMTNGIQLLK
jgi:hypothetical protein